MTEREKLIELLKSDSCESPMLCDPNCKYANLERCYEERTADFLLENGVIVPPVKVGSSDRYTICAYCDGCADVMLREGISVGDAICQLADYENTGLSPAEIKALIAEKERDDNG